MLKQKLKNNKENIKIDSTLLNSVRSYCKGNGIKYSFYIERAVIEKLEKDNILKDKLE